MLPHHNWILLEARGIFLVGIALIGKEPSAVTVPEPQLCIVRIGVLVTGSVMANVIGSPLESGVLQGPSPRDQKDGFHPVGTAETPVGDQMVVPDRNAQSRDDVEDHEHGPIEPGISVCKAE